MNTRQLGVHKANAQGAQGFFSILYSIYICIYIHTYAQAWRHINAHIWRHVRELPMTQRLLPDHPGIKDHLRLM